ncbi:glycosyltransferase involved in cell wall biosynthesis [Pedobacter sp. AK017]|uniref:glycosyltransferase family 4 protein n=1 Tax=Pedobacter sp. AK017 TaxID=2723073 RepID=UPI00160EC545|nr:glycosyltransferase family 1 protein [Pedobacter sp. AK017]MBB5441222.1 glycosyltransferase involved in cell wall biosynthesis [Pedobacter sp. AK017]
MKKILINALLLNEEKSGVQYSIESLICGLSGIKAKDYKLEVLVPQDYDGCINETDNLKIKHVNLSKRLERIYFEHVSVPFYLKKNSFNLYHCPGYILPFFSKTSNVVTIHDLMAIDYPKLCQNETAAYFNMFLPNTIKNAQKIITVSNVVKNDILNKYSKIDESKIEVIYPGIGKHFQKIPDTHVNELVKKKYNLPPKYFLFVGNLEPKKNIERIIEAYHELKKNVNIDHKLLIVGRRAWKFSSIFKLVVQKKLQSEVLFLGYVNENDLPSIYSSAEIFIFPSIYEGFGIPVLEAMACGCPTIISNRGALPEISGGICLQVDPFSITEIVNAVSTLLMHAQFRELSIIKGINWSKKFTWDLSAEKTDKLYNSLI